jgi:urease accessory protein
MDTQATTTMGTKRSRRRTARDTRARRVVRAAGLTALTPARAGIQQQPRLRKGVAARQASARVPRGDERTRRGAAKNAGSTAGNLNAAALYRLMAWLSPAYPIGAFSYSSGIEWAVEAGDVTDAATFERWLAVMIADGSGFCDAVFFVHAHRAVAQRNDEALHAVAELAAAFAPSQERHLETTAQGRAFLDATRAAWPTPALDRLLAVWHGVIALPVAVAAASAGHDIALAPALQAYLHALTANLVSAGVRLVPLGQTDGQRVLAALEPVVAATAARALATALEDVGGAAFRADLASMRHETQYTRLFRS